MGGKTIRNEATKLAGFQVNASTYGLPAAVVFGTTRISGNVIDYFDFTAHAHTSTQRSGKGGGKVVTTTYTYTVATAIGLCEGPVAGIGKVWKDKGVLENAAQTGFTVFNGERGQTPWSYSLSKHPERALPYSGLCYVAGVADLGEGASLSEFNFEVRGVLLADGLDANPADVIKKILNDTGIEGKYIDLDSLDRYRTFCYCADMFISLGLTDTDKAVNIIDDICLATNTAYYWSQNKLKFTPRAEEEITRGGKTYIPNITPVYDLTDDDFKEQDGGDLVSFERVDRSEAYNHVTVEFLNRENEYNKEQVEFKVQSDINRRGLKSMSTQNLYCLQTKARAEYAAANIAHDSMYSRTRYKFSLDWSKCLLEPGDIVTLTTGAGITLERKSVEIIEIEEEGDGILNFTAVEKNIGAGGPAIYPSQDAGRGDLNINQAPADTQAPAIYHYPTSEPIVGIAVCGTNPARWGGCEVWVSVDGDTYEYIGEVTGPSRYGRLLTGMSAADTAVEVELCDKSQQLLPVSEEAAAADSALILIDNEWIAYQGAELIGAGQYRLSGLRRGRVGTAATAHDTGDHFVRHDQASGFRYNYYEKDIGQAIRIKLPAKNIFGLNVQELDALPAYQYIITNAGQTVTEKRIVEITGISPDAAPEDAWAFFSFENSFSAPPDIFYVVSQTASALANFRDLSAAGFEAQLISIDTGKAVNGTIMYEANGR
jgi:hypothetical protein